MADPDRPGQLAQRELLGPEFPDAPLGRVDLASLDSVRRFAREWRGEIDLLINNAGVVLAPGLTRAKDGSRRSSASTTLATSP